VDLDQVQFNTFLARQDAHDFEALLTLWSPDPGLGGAEQNWATASIAKGGQNMLAYSNPAFDALLDSARTSFDPDRAHAYGRRAFQVIIDDAPAIWLYDGVQIGGISRRFDVAPMRADEGWWPHLANWSIPANQRIARDRIGLAPRKP
jgi:ABC-type transport system substrate-binding protein